MRMKTFCSRWWVGVGAGLVLVGGGFAASAPRPTAPIGTRAANSSRTTPSGRAVLPDPVLLDGSTQPAEKKSEYGMIGDFELPGDENARDGKVGGAPGGGGQEESPDPNAKPGGGGGGKPDPAAKEGEGQGGQAVAQEGGGGAEPKPGEKPGGGGAGEPGAQAQGIKVAELGGDPSGAGDQQSKQKPSTMEIGDKAMRIPQQTQSAAGVVGAQQPAGKNTQVYEKGTGTGGKGPTGQQGPNRVEKGRAIPAGL